MVCYFLLSKNGKENLYTALIGYIWYYAHEQDKVKFLRNTLYELLEKELVNYLREK